MSEKNGERKKKKVEERNKRKTKLFLTSPSGTSSSELVVSTVLRSKVASRVQSTASPSSGPLMETLQ